MASEDDRYLCKNIYWCHLLYVILLLLLLLLLLLWHICISDVRSFCLGNGLAPNGLPGPIPQFRDNLFKTHGYFAIKQNETNISSSTIYLKTNKITNTTITQILHRVYAHHIYITKPQQQTRPNWRHTPPCEILLSHLVVTGPWRNEARNLENCILRLVVDIG